MPAGKVLSRKNVEKIVPAGTDVVTVGSEVNDNIIVYNIGDLHRRC